MIQKDVDILTNVTFLFVIIVEPVVMTMMIIHTLTILHIQYLNIVLLFVSTTAACCCGNTYYHGNNT